MKSDTEKKTPYTVQELLHIPFPDDLASIKASNAPPEGFSRVNPLNYLTYVPEPRWRTFYVKRYLEFPSVFEENKGTYKINSLHPICPASGSKEKVSGSDHTENETGIYHLASSPEMPQIEVELLNEQV